MHRSWLVVLALHGLAACKDDFNTGRCYDIQHTNPTIGPAGPFAVGTTTTIALSDPTERYSIGEARLPEGDALQFKLTHVTGRSFDLEAQGPGSATLSVSTDGFCTTDPELVTD